jgi:hypothetical protein
VVMLFGALLIVLDHLILQDEAGPLHFLGHHVRCFGGVAVDVSNKALNLIQNLFSQHVLLFHSWDVLQQSSDETMGLIIF